MEEKLNIVNQNRVKMNFIDSKLKKLAEKNPKGQMTRTEVNLQIQFMKLSKENKRLLLEIKKEKTAHLVAVRLNRLLIRDETRRMQDALNALRAAKRGNNLQ